MSSSANQPDLIIALSRDKVTLNLAGKGEREESQLRTSFEVENLFMEEEISQYLDQVLTDHPVLIDQFPCVEIILIDRPNIALPGHYAGDERLAEIASRHLRLRAGDTLSTDAAGDQHILCYTMPIDTLQMLREYYANISVTHLSAVLWQALSNQNISAYPSVTCFTIIYDTLIVLSAKNGALVFSKCFSIREEADLFYYSIAVSRLLKTDMQWLVTVENEEVTFELPGDSILKIDQYISLPSLHALMAQFKPCES